MKKLYIVLLLGFILMLPTGYSYRKMDYRKARLNNVCKDLKGDALLYFIFVDNAKTTPWTEFDIQSTIDSIRMAINWIHTQAKKDDIQVNIIADFYIGKEYTTVRKNLPGENVFESISKPNMKKGYQVMNKWADDIVRVVGSALPIHEKDGIPEIKNPRNKERLAAYLRDENNVESVALFFLVNNYFKNDISIQLNTMNTNDVEFAVVSYKYPSEMAHNFLHLYGAADMYETLYRRNKKKIKILLKEFPNEIMQDPYGKDIWELEISDYTKYLIGWKDDLNPRYEPLMTDSYMNY